MTREEIKELYNAISTVFEGDYTPEDELLEYDETFSDDDEYTEALVDIFENNKVEFDSYVGGAKDFLFDFYEDIEHLRSSHPNEYLTLEKYGLLK